MVASTPAKHLQVDLRIWNAFYSVWRSADSVLGLSYSYTTDSDVNTGTLTLAGDTVLGLELGIVRTGVPVPVTIELNGVLWSGQITSATKGMNGGKTTWECTLESDHKHLHRMLARDVAVSALDGNVEQLRAPLSELTKRLVSEGAVRTGLPVYILTEGQSDLVEVEVRTEDSIHDVLGEAIKGSQQHLDVHMLLPEHDLPEGAGTLEHYAGVMERRWEQDRLDAGEWPDAKTNPRIAGKDAATAFKLPANSWQGRGGTNAVGEPVAGEGICWQPFETVVETTADYFKHRPTVEVRWATREKLNEQQRTIARGFSSHVTYWQAGTFVATKKLEQCAGVGMLVDATGTVLEDAAAALAYVGEGEAAAWKNGARWVLANAEHFKAEQEARKARGAKQRQTPALLVHLHPERDRRAVVFSSVAGGGLEAWSTTHTAPDAAMLVAGGQMDAAAIAALSGGVGVSTSVPAGEAQAYLPSGATVPDTVQELDINAQPLATVDGTDVSYSTAGGKVDVGKAGAFFYREKYMSLATGASNPLGEVTRAWAEAQGTTSMSLTTGAAIGVVFGADVTLADGTTVYGWRAGDRVSFVDGDTRISEVISGYEVTVEKGIPRVTPILGRRSTGVLSQLTNRLRTAEKQASRAIMAPPRRVSSEVIAGEVGTVVDEKVESLDSRLSATSTAVQDALNAVAEMQARLDQGVDTSRFDELMAEHATKLDDLAAALAAFDVVDAERRAALEQLGADLRAASAAVREVEDAVRDNATRFAGFESRQEDADKKLDSLALESGMLQAGNLVWNPLAKENMSGWLVNSPLSGTYFATGGVTTECVRVKWNGTPVQKNIDFGYPDTQTYFPIQPNQEFLASVWVRPTVELPAGAMRLDFSGASTVSSPVLPANTWTKIEGVIKVNSNNTAKRSWLRLVHTTAIPADAEWDICNPTVVEMAGEVLVVDGAITARKIGAGEITANHIKSGEITSDILTVRNGFIKSAMIGAGEIKTANIDNAAITTAKIGNLAVKTGNIDNLAVTDAKIGSLNAGKIDAGYLNAGRINTGSLHGNKITAGTLTAKEIAANTITGNEIAANSIMANKLQITAGNLFPDPHFMDSCWGRLSSTSYDGSLVLEASGVQKGTYYLPAGVPADTAIEIEPGAVYRLTTRARFGGTNGITYVSVYCRYRDTSGASKVSSVGRIPRESQVSYKAGTVSTNLTFPSDMASGECTLGFYIEREHADGHVFLWETQLYRAADSLLIVDGAIQAKHVSSGSITTNHIATAGISAGVIKTGTMSADRISGGSIDGKLIKAGTLTADRVNANEIYLKKDGSDNLKEQWDDFQFALAMINNAITVLADKVYKLQSQASGFYVLKNGVLTASSDGMASNRFRITNSRWIALGSWRGRAWHLTSSGTATLTRVDANDRDCGPSSNNSSLFYEVDPVDTITFTLAPTANYDLPRSTWTTIPAMTYTAPANSEEVQWDGKVTFTNVHRGSTYGVRVLVGGKAYGEWTSNTFGPLTPVGSSTYKLNFSGNAKIAGGQRIEIQGYCDNSSAEKRRVTTATSVPATIYYTI